MYPPQRQQPARDGFACVLQAVGLSQRLRGDRHDGRQRVLHPVVQFLQQNALELRGDLELGSINASLLQ